jgi:four helix bundle protein
MCRDNDEFRMTKNEGMPKSTNRLNGIDLMVASPDWSSRLREDPDGVLAYHLEERTACFGERVIDFARDIPQGPVTNRLIEQLVGCATSIGANYGEADDAVSRKEFFLRICTCRKEARETKHFLRMIVRAAPDMSKQARELWDEARQLHLIFCKIFRGKSNPG